MVFIHSILQTGPKMHALHPPSFACAAYTVLRKLSPLYSKFLWNSLDRARYIFQLHLICYLQWCESQLEKRYRYGDTVY